MITPSRLVKAAVVGFAAAAICSLLPPVTSAVAARPTAVNSAVTQGPAVPAPPPGSSAGSLFGTVRALGGSGLAGVCVTATGPTGTVPGFTTAGGRYFLDGLRPGEYRIGFRACAQPGRYGDQSYGRPVFVGAGHPTMLRPVTLRPADPMADLTASARASRSQTQPAGAKPQVSGTVTDSRGKPLAGICVTANSVSNDARFVKTGARGTYQFHSGELKPGRWQIFFSVGCGNKGNFAPQWWKFATTEKSAKVLVVHGDSHFTGINARLGKGASVSGTVRAGSKSGPGLPGVCVEADGPNGTFAQSEQAVTGRDGRYLITGLGTGRYAVQFSPGCGNKGNFADPLTFRTVSVTDGKITKGVDGFLPRAGGISGAVTTGPHHRPLGGICVQGTTDSAQVTGAFETWTRPNGKYAFNGLTPGRYEIDFSAGCGSKGSFAPQFYKNQVSELATNPVLIKGGAKISGIDAVMQPGGIVTGTVTDAVGKKLTGVCVLLQQQFEDTGADFDILIGGGEGALPFGAITTTADGRYRVIDLPEDNYAVSFFTGCRRHEPAQASRWFSPQGGNRMTLLTVGPGTVRAINAKLPAPGTITGVVTGPSGKPARGICVFAEGLTGEPSNTLAVLVSGSFGAEWCPGGSPGLALRSRSREPA